MTHIFKTKIRDSNTRQIYRNNVTQTGKGNESDYWKGLIYIANLDDEFAIDDMIDSNDPNSYLWFQERNKQFFHVTNGGLIVGFINEPEFSGTYMLVPIHP